MTEKLEYEIIWKTRRLFQALARKSDQLLKPLGLSAADRAVMEFLYPSRELTVPQMARRFQVSRQHIQTTVNRLLDQGFVVATANPDHVRSKLLLLSVEGRTMVAAIRDREEDIIDRLFEGVDNAEKMVAEKVLRTLLDNA